MSFDAIGFFTDYSIPYWTEGNNVTSGWVNIRCCFCSDHSNHLGINPDEGYAVCWRCGGHSLKDIAYNLIGNSRIISDYTSIGKQRNGIQRNKKQANAQQIKVPGTALNRYHYRYLLKRNFDPDVLVDKYKIQGVLHVPTDYKFRIIIPIILHNQIVSFQSRACFKTDRRYLTCPIEKEIIHHKHLMYNADNCYTDTVIVLEGVPDVWRMGDNCVCGFGTELTSEQLSFISQRWKKVIFLFDPEKEAMKKAKKYCNELSMLGINCEVVEWDNPVDPGDLSDEDAKNLKNQLLNTF